MLGFRLDAMQRHELSNSILAHQNAVGKQLFPDARPTVLTLDLGVDRLYVGQQDGLLRLARLNVFGPDSVFACAGLHTTTYFLGAVIAPYYLRFPTPESIALPAMRNPLRYPVLLD
jgi:hypothetical protein